MGHLWSNIKASPENRGEAGDSRLFWSLCLGTFYSLLAQGYREKEGTEAIHEVRQAQCPPGTLASDPVSSLREQSGTLAGCPCCLGFCHSGQIHYVLGGHVE